jgi:acetyl-CoA acetyltransferase
MHLVVDLQMELIAMMYNAPIPSGVGKDGWTDKLTSQDEFEAVITAVTDSVLSLDKAIALVDDVDVETLLRVFRERRRQSKRALIDVGLTTGFRAEHVEASGSEKMRRAWMELKSKVADSDSVVGVLLRGEEATLEELDNSLGKGLPEAVEYHIRSTAAEMRSNLDLLTGQERL